MTATTDAVVANDKSGNLMTAIAHIFCAVVGAGVLGLPNSLGWLGWVAGPIFVVFFFLVSLWTSALLADVYRVEGLEFARYHHAVRHILGNRGAFFASLFQILNLVLVCVAYTITGAKAMKTVADRIGSSFDSTWKLTLIMGGLELFFSQLPNLEEIWWVSLAGTISSLLYCTIALVLGCVYAGNRYGSVGGIPGVSDADKAFNVLNALGNLGFAYSFAQVLLEIQDTLRQPPPANRTMKKAINVGVTGAFCFYLSVAVTGYAALGDEVPGEVLEGFDQAPDWPIILANLAIAIHMVTAYQVFAQPIFETIESHIKAFILKRSPDACKCDTAGVEAAPGSAAKLAGLVHLPAHAHVQMAHHAHHAPSPFDTIAEEPSNTLDLAESGGQQQQQQQMTPAASAARMGTPLGSRRMSLGRVMSARVSDDGMVVCNSCPIPEVLPSAGWQPSRRTMHRRVAGSHDDLHGMGKAGSTVKASAPPSIARSSIRSALGSQAMYCLDTGAANETVPLNEHGYFLPFWQRVCIRSTFVVLVTLVACVMPFFSSVVGLVGSVCFFPLSVFFPMAMYKKVHKPSPRVVTVMYVVGSFMLLVACAATVAAFRNIVVSWSTYQVFSD